MRRRLIHLTLAGLLSCAGEEGELVPGDHDSAMLSSDKTLEDRLRDLDEPATMGIGMKVNQDVLRLMDEIKKECTLAREKNTIVDCSNNQVHRLIKWVQKKRPDDTMLSLANTAISGKPDGQFVARRIIARIFAVLPTAARRRNASKETVEVYLRLLRQSRGRDALEITPIATQIAVLGGDSPLLQLIAAEHPVEGVRSAVLRWLMVYGGTEEVKVLKAAATEKNGAFLLDAILGAQKTRHTEQVKAVLCPWVSDHLKNPNAEVAGAAVASAARCGGAAADMVLIQAQQRLRGDRFEKPFSSALHNMCPDYHPSNLDKETKRRCRRTFKLLESVLRNKTLDSARRAEALTTIYRQRRDKATVKLVRKHTKHSDRVIRSEARRILKELTSVYGFR